jgi:hypothetical protein
MCNIDDDDVFHRIRPDAKTITEDSLSLSHSHSLTLTLSLSLSLSHSLTHSLTHSLSLSLLRRIRPGAITIAEDVSGMPTLGRPVSEVRRCPRSAFHRSQRPFTRERALLEAAFPPPFPPRAVGSFRIQESLFGGRSDTRLSDTAERCCCRSSIHRRQC